MRISVFGCGHLGAVHAACMAKLGHDVVGIDTADHVVASLTEARSPFFEPGLEELLLGGTSSGRLEFTTDSGRARAAVVHFICVGTPQLAGGMAADLTYLDSAIDALLPLLKPGDVVVGKSTVPVGTAERIAELIHNAQPGADLIWNPEFLREGKAVRDTLCPDRIVYGIRDSESSRKAAAQLDEVYAPILAAQQPKLETDLATAQLVKVAANSFLATKISFINAMADLCDAAGADVTMLAEALGLDPRIGRSFLNAGIGFGGGCLPKDIRGFMARAGELGADHVLKLLGEVDAINLGRRTMALDLARHECGGSLDGRRVAVLGAAFKPDSDDIRDSPALEIAARIQGEGATVTIADPKALGNARSEWPQLDFAQTVGQAVTDADLVLVLTEWPEYVCLDPIEMRERVAVPRIIDGRNCLNPVTWRSAGWTYRAFGRPDGVAQSSPSENADSRSCWE